MSATVSQTNAATPADGVAEAVAALSRDGVTGLKGAFPRDWVEQMREDMMTAFWSAIQRPGGAVGRGPRRWYVEMHPQELQGFVDLVTHPWVSALCEAVLGPRYEIVEVGFDTPFQGAKNQPWHRDFPSPPETYDGRRITSLAFNLTGVDVTADMGPFEVVPGTQWEDGRTWKHQMFPNQADWTRYAARGVKKYPEMGDISCRSALTIHRGTAHPSPVSRPVLVLGVDAPGAGRRAFGAARSHGHAGLLRRAAASRPRPPRLPRGGDARARDPEARHRGLGHGRGVKLRAGLAR